MRKALLKHGVFICVWVTAIAVFMPIGATWATDYYITTSGSNSNDGSSGSPWLTLQKAADTMSPGDIVHVADGTYAGAYISASGTETQPITFLAAGNNVRLTDRNSVTTDIMNIEGGDYIIIDGFKCENSPRIGIRIVNATGVEIRNNEISNSGHCGILTGWTPEIKIIGNISYGAQAQHGIYVSNSRVTNDDVIVRGNECYGNNQNGIQLNGDCWEGGDGIISNALLEDNVIHGNNWKGFSLISVQNSIIRNNVIYDNGISAGAGGIHLADQPDCSLPSINNVVVNNTIVEPRIACMRMTDGSSPNVVFNTLIVARSSTYTIVDEVGGNLIDTASNLLYTSASGLFVDESNDNYRLDTGSPAIDAGVSIYQGEQAPVVDVEGKARPVGTTWDAGAYEQGTAIPDNTSPEVNITDPFNNETVSGVISVSATATDNVGVLGVQFKVDGGDLGAEVTQAPYEKNLTTTSMANGGHVLTAVARDAAGNTDTSPAVNITVENAPPVGGIRANHPRLIFTPERLAEVRAAACFDAAGNPIVGCTPSPQSTRLLNFVDLCYVTPENCYIIQPRQYVMAYLLTGELKYAEKGIAESDAQIADGLSDERSSFFLHADNAILETAVVFDWLYDMLTAQQKEDYIDYMNRLVQEMFVEDPLNNPFYEAYRWATNDPGNNYYYAQLKAAVTTAIATYGENDFTVPLDGVDVPMELYFKENGQTYNDMLEFCYAKIEQEAQAVWIDVHGRGGGWHEGIQYGAAAKNQIFIIYLFLRDAGGKDYFTTTSFPRNAAHFMLYANNPDNIYRYNGGDAGRDKDVPVCGYTRETAIELASGLVGTVESEYAQYWANHDRPTMGGGWQFMYASDLQWTNLNLPERNYNELPTAYFAEGLGWMNSRTSWEDDAISVTFICTDRIQDHQHKDQNSFTIFHGESQLGWLAIDANFCYSSNGLTSDTQIHNAILVNGEGQRYGDGTGEVLKHELTDEYRYVVGDATDAYWVSPGGWGHGIEPYLSTYQREFVHAMPNYVVVYDRVTPLQAFETADVSYLLNMQFEPDISGNTVTAVNGDKKMVQRTLLPETDYLIEIKDSERCFRVEVKQTIPTTNRQLLHVIYVGDATSTMPPTELVTAAADNMVGAHIKETGNNIVLMFSSDPEGAIPQGSVIYELGATENTTNYLYGLLPETEYNVEVVNRADGQTIVVSRGRGKLTTGNGTLVYEAIYEWPPKVATSR